MSATILAGVTAAGLALVVNLLLGKAGAMGIKYLGPVLEEVIKTGAALFFNGSVPGVHLLFGVLEAAGDYAWGGKRKSLAALSGIAAHAVFGLTTYFLIREGYPVYTGVLASIAAHIAWNSAVLKILK